MIILITGLKQSGKSTFANELEKYGFKHLQFAEKLKNMANKMMPIIFEDIDFSKIDIDWESNEFKQTVIPSIFNKKEMTYRGFLQKFGTDFIREHINNDYWKDTLYNSITDGQDVVVSDLRFINEIDNEAPGGTIVIGVDRGYELEENDHASEMEIPEMVKRYTHYNIDSNCSYAVYKERIHELIFNYLPIDCSRIKKINVKTEPDYKSFFYIKANEGYAATFYKIIGMSDIIWYWEKDLIKLIGLQKVEAIKDRDCS